MTILIPVLGDQLSHDLASLRDVAHEDAVVLMMEVAEETTYVRQPKAGGGVLRSQESPSTMLRMVPLPCKCRGGFRNPI